MHSSLLEITCLFNNRRYKFTYTFIGNSINTHVIIEYVYKSVVYQLFQLVFELSM